MVTDTEAVDLVGDEVVVNIARAALFAALMGGFAYVSFPNPFSPAPITLQVLGVFLAGIMLGPVWGPAAMVLYLIAGALGAPIFAFGSAGLGVLLGPNVGYLVSFPLAAGIIGFVVHRGVTLRDIGLVPVPTLVGAMVIGTILIYTLGTVGMMFVLALGPVEAFLVGAAAFLPAEIFKIIAAIGIVRSDVLKAS